MTMQDFDVIEVQDDLTVTDIERICSFSSVAVDTETTGIDLNRDILCLVQLCDATGQVYLVRAPDWKRAPNLAQVLAAPYITKVCHFAVFDYSIVYRVCGIEMTNIYCTKVASKIARTYTGNHGLAALVKEFFEFEMNKNAQSSDWLNSPLSAEQRRYAAGDVVWLLEIRDRLERLIERKGFLPSGISYSQLNQRCQEFIPTLAHLVLNGWDFGEGNRSSIFSH